jgi:hypothetical protein
MAVCRATKANGEPCTLSANGPQGLCWAHGPGPPREALQDGLKGGQEQA